VTTAVEATYYTDCVRQLLQLTSLQEYTEQLLQYTAKWSKSFLDYFISNVHSVITKLGAWELRVFGLESSTTNQSESFNNVLKHLQEWKEAPIDAMALSLFRLAQFHITEISRGRAGFGNYQLRNGLMRSDQHTQLVSVLDPENIVTNIRFGCSERGTEESGERMDQGSREAAGEGSEEGSGEVAGDRSGETAHHGSREVVGQGSREVAGAGNMATSKKRASRIITAGQISLNPQLSIFTMNGSQEPRVVRLFPRTTCSCPAQSGCYHIIAARMAVGLDDDAPRRVINLTQLRRNKRKRQDKTSGRKHPRVNDLDVVAAGDADPAAAAAVLETEPALSGGGILITVEEAGDDEGVVVGDPVMVINTCYKCKGANPPTGKRKDVPWVSCERCSKWFHCVCVGARRNTCRFICHIC